jgi:hypothetical protein
MRTFVIIRYHVAGSGHSITVVKAINQEEALNKYITNLHMDSIPIGTNIREITEDVDEVFYYDNPDYRG